MRARGRAALLAVALLVPALAPAADPRIGRFVRYETGEYTIVTSRSSAQAKGFVSALGKFRVTLEKTLGRRAKPNAFPTTIVIVSATEWQKYLQPRAGIAGYFQGARFSNYLSMNGDADDEWGRAVMFHEYTHYYLASQFAGEYPPWFNEGLAELMGYAKFDKGMAILRIPMDRLYEARDGDWIPFDRLIKVDHNSPEYQSHRMADSFYAQAWLTMHYGLVENREFGRKILQYLNSVNTLHSQEDAARTAFGDLGGIDAELRAASRNAHLHSGGIQLGDVPDVTLPAGVPLDDDDAYAVLIDLMLESRLGPTRLRPLIEALQRREPDRPRGAIFAARLAVLDEDNAAFDAATARAEGQLSPTDWMSRRELADVLLASALDYSPMSTRKSEDSERDLKRAFKLYGEAVAHNGKDVEALWGFGTTATRLGRNLDLAESALLTAYALAPSNADIAVSLANLKSQQEKPDEMLPYLDDAVRYATDLGTRRWAAETLERMKAFIVERDRVDQENAKQRAAYEKQLADYEKKYGKRKKK